MAARRLLLLTHEYLPFPGGVARYCYSMASAAARAGFAVTLFAPQYTAYEAGTAAATGRAGDAANVGVAGRADAGDIAAAADEAGFAEHGDVEVVRFPGGVFEMKQLKALREAVSRIIGRQAWHIVHAADWPMILVMGGLDPRAQKKIASFHGTDVMILRHAWRARLNGSAASMKGFDRYACNSAFTKSKLAAAFPKLTADRLVVASLGVDETWFEPPSDVAMTELRTRIEYDVADRIVLTVARIDPRKGHLLTLRALSRLAAPLRDRIKYVCIGLWADPSLVQQLEAQAAAYGVRIYLTGALSTPEVRAAYSIAAVFALTAEPMDKKIEGFGLVLLEAAAAGLRAVVTRVHAIPEVVLDNRTGWILGPDDIDGLANRLEHAVMNVPTDDVRAACVAHAKQATWDRCAELTYQRPGSL